MRRTWPLAVLAGGVSLQWLASLSPVWVERLYSRGLYRALRSVFAFLTGWVPFSIIEVAGEVTLAGLLWHGATTKWWRRLSWRAAGRAGLRLGWGLLAASAVLYPGFLLLWGLNHQRLPLATLAGFSDLRSDRAQLLALCEDLVVRSDTLRAGLEEDERGVMRLRAGQGAALRGAHEGLRRAATQYPALAGWRVSAKPAVLSPVMSWLGISGIFIPFTGEAHVNTTLPDPDLPFAASHELAHQRGFAREDEANYLAFVACRLHPEPEFQYSGTLAASFYAQGALREQDRRTAAALDARRSAAVRRDMKAIAEWRSRYYSRLSEASRQVNDAYLKSQGQELGVESYGAMVDLMLAERRVGGAR